MHLLLRRRDCRAKRRGFATVILLMWLCVSFAAADSHGAVEHCFLTPWLQAHTSKTWRAKHYNIACRSIKSLQHQISGHYWRRSLGSIGKAEEKYTLGDYSPHPDVDVAIGSPPPPVFGKRRKLLQDYTPVANFRYSPPPGS